MLLGIVPDTNAMVILRLRGGGSRTAPVTHGVVVTLAAGVTAVLVKGINGAASVVPRPPVA
jgi:hypothetical protein